MQHQENAQGSQPTAMNTDMNLHLCKHCKKQTTQKNDKHYNLEKNKD